MRAVTTYHRFKHHRGELAGASSLLFPAGIEEWDSSDWENPMVIPGVKTYKPAPTFAPPVPDPFPLLSQNPPPPRSLLQAPEVNRPPKRHYPEQTPLFVGFTRNWPQLLQCVVSYIAAGWPPEDIHVVENTGVMYANREGKLTLQNPFYLNHTQLEMLGVNVIVVCPFSSLDEQLTAGLTTLPDTHPPDLFPTPKLLPLVRTPSPNLLSPY